VLRALRQAEILAAARTGGAVRVGELTRRFGVSGPTIRRDLEDLAGRGLLARVHGGAVRARAGAPSQSTVDCVARAAAALVPPGSAVGLSAGPRAATLATHLGAIPGLTIVTPSLPAATRLEPANGQVVILVGGVRASYGGHTGPVAVQTLSQVNLDVVFLDVRGMSPRTGYTAVDMLTAEIHRALLHRAARTVVIADHTAWGAIGVATIASLSEVDTVVVDSAFPREARALLAATVPHLLVAHPPIPQSPAPQLQ
jgi:DeoR/GlpR family transcriptional regulator of sugar metabolism